MTRKMNVLPEVRMERRRSTGRTLTSTLVAGHLLKRKEEMLGFLESLRKKKAKKALADGRTIVPIE